MTDPDPFDARFTLRMPLDLLAKVQLRARRERRSVNAQIIALVEESLAGKPDG